jgi:hypothetical protein
LIKSLLGGIRIKHVRLLFHGVIPISNIITGGDPNLLGGGLPEAPYPMFGKRFVSRGRDPILFSRRENYRRKGEVAGGRESVLIWFSEGGKTWFDARKIKVRPSSELGFLGRLYRY